jgi:hypothetical protein
MVGLLFVNVFLLKSQEFNYYLNVIPYVITSFALYIDEQQTRSTRRFLLFPALMSFFLLLLLQKGLKLQFVNDESIHELVDVMQQHQGSWNNRSVFVTGSTDLSGFLLLEGQRVERINAVHRLSDFQWHDPYDCVIELINVRILEDRVDNPASQFWSRWKKACSYQSKHGQFALSIYESHGALCASQTNFFWLFNPVKTAFPGSYSRFYYQTISMAAGL